jgi:hypothetical protein
MNRWICLNAFAAMIATSATYATQPASPTGVSVSTDEAPSKFPLVCRGGGSMSFRFSQEKAMITVYFKGGTKPSGQGLAPGECSWRDRGLRDGEPPFLCLHGITGFQILWGVDPIKVIPHGFRQALALGYLRDPNAVVTFNVVNEGTCMRLIPRVNSDFAD